MKNSKSPAETNLHKAKLATATYSEAEAADYYTGSNKLDTIATVKVATNPITDNPYFYLEFPETLVDKLQWKKDDQIQWDIADNCFDWGEVPSFVLRNLTKEQRCK